VLKTAALPATSFIKFLLGLLFGPEDGGSILLRNYSWLSPTTRHYIPEGRTPQDFNKVEYSIFRCGHLSKESVQVRGFLRSFVTSLFFGEELLAPRPTPKLEDHPLSTARDCLFNIFAATLQNWMASLPSTTWGAPCPFDKGANLVSDIKGGT
jgi:hypothetical protein